MHGYDIVGMVGIALIIGAYFFLQMERLRSDDLLYSLANGFGAICILYSIYFAFNLSAFLVELFWLLISLVGVIRYCLRKRTLTEANADG